MLVVLLQAQHLPVFQEVLKWWLIAFSLLFISNMTCIRTTSVTSRITSTSFDLRSSRVSDRLIIN